MAAESVEVIQSMIDISADRLERLRTQCATSAELTQQETRTLESKLIRMFSELLLTKQKLPDHLALPQTNYDLKQWLRVVGLSPETINTVIQRVNTLETLLIMREEEISAILVNSQTVQEEEARRLSCAISNLNRCHQCLKAGGKEPSDMLYWDSWDRHNHIRLNSSPRTHHRLNQDTTTSSLASASNTASSTSILSQSQTESHHSGVNFLQSPLELSPPDASQATTATTTPSSGDKLTSTMSPEDISTHTLSPSPSPPNSPTIINMHQPSQSQNQNLLINRLRHNHLSRINHKYIHPNNLNNNVISNNNSKLVNHMNNCGGNGHHQMNHFKFHHSDNYHNNNNINNSNLNTINYNNNNEVEVQLVDERGENLADNNLLLKNSKSQESQLSSNGQNSPDTFHGSKKVPVPAPRTSNCRYNQDYNHDDGGGGGHHMATTVIVSDVSGPPRSPCTPVRVMGHMIQHRFTKKFKFTSSTCDLCNKQMFFGFKCTECKYRCHKDCKSSVPPSCGLPKEFVDEFRKIIGGSTGTGGEGLIPPNSSPNMMIRGPGLLPTKRSTDTRVPRSQIQHTFMGPDSSSAGSSCNSSSPSSPALHTIPPHTPATSNKSQFNFPEIPNNHHMHHTHPGIPEDVYQESQQAHHHQDEVTRSIIIQEPPQIRPRNNNYNNYQRSLTSLINHSNKQEQDQNNSSLSVSDCNSLGGSSYHQIPRLNLSDSGRSIDSDKTVTSNESDRTRLESVDERESSMWPRQNSLSLKEWDIPYDDLKIMDIIGRGRFGTVHRALWHGDVAVKILKEDYLDEHTLEAFKLEVATFKKTRHDNLVLFMGACMKPPRLAIVTSLCKGNTLFTHIHLRKDKFNLNRTTLVAQQISQGMGYLHARGIVHKDLKTKNIFLENEKVIITDFGLFSVTKLLYCEMGLGIPSGWLCYLAPELIKKLKPYRPTNEDLPFSNSSDTFAFGTIWYELLCGEFPFKAQPPESVIWQLGRGMKQSLANLQASRDVKDILMLCWSYQADDRPDFTQLLNMLERLPKKRLARSPSHPIQLSRSAESVF